MFDSCITVQKVRSMLLHLIIQFVGSASTLQTQTDSICLQIPTQRLSDNLTL